MFEWFRRRKQPYIESQILNDGLSYAMEFGKNWLQPIQSRLTKLYPALTGDELCHYNELCQKAMNAGNDRVYELVKKCGEGTSFEQFKADMAATHPWINESNLKQLYGQGRYYAWKDLGC